MSGKQNSVAVLLAGILTWLGPVQAQTYPARTIEFVTQSSVGGGGDVLARQLAEASREFIGQAMVVVNKPGAGGRNLENYLNAARPDGHTLVVTTATSVLWYYTGSLTMNVNEDLRPIIRLQVEPNLVIVNATAPWQNMKELIAAARADQITFGGNPIGSPEHMFFTQLAADHGYQLNFVAYGGGGEAAASLLGNNIQATILQNSEAVDLVAAGRIRIIGVASAERLTQVPGLQDAPTLREQGIDFVFEHWRGIHTLAGVPDDVVKFLHAAFQKATEKDSWQKWLRDTGQVAGNLDPVAFKAYTLEQDRFVEGLATKVGVNKRN
jgi:putative tricarboxylic transport membrane protein